jgi:ABC-type branched-subunit amino acid transport system ATPase component
VYHNDIKTTNEKEFLLCRIKMSFVPSDDYLYPKLTCGENIEMAKDRTQRIERFSKDSFQRIVNLLI